jgi:hypothetical protein
MQIVKHPSWSILACYFLGHDWKQIIDTVPCFLLRKCPRCGLEVDERDDFTTFANKELGED